MLTDVKGIRDANGRHLSTVSRKDVQRMVKRGTISEGMLPKVHACLDALADGVGKAHIVDGRVPHAILLEIFTHKGIGTEISGVTDNPTAVLVQGCRRGRSGGGCTDEVVFRFFFLYSPLIGLSAIRFPGSSGDNAEAGV